MTSVTGVVVFDATTRAAGEQGRGIAAAPARGRQPLDGRCSPERRADPAAVRTDHHHRAQDNLPRTGDRRHIDGSPASGGIGEPGRERRGGAGAGARAEGPGGGDVGGGDQRRPGRHRQAGGGRAVREPAQVVQVGALTDRRGEHDGTEQERDDRGGPQVRDDQPERLRGRVFLRHHQHRRGNRRHGHHREHQTRHHAEEARSGNRCHSEQPEGAETEEDQEPAEAADRESRHSDPAASDGPDPGRRRLGEVPHGPCPQCRRHCQGAGGQVEVAAHPFLEEPRRHDGGDRQQEQQRGPDPVAGGVEEGGRDERAIEAEAADHHHRQGQGVTGADRGQDGAERIGPGTAGYHRRPVPAKPLRHPRHENQRNAEVDDPVPEHLAARQRGHDGEPDDQRRPDQPEPQRRRRPVRDLGADPAPPHPVAAQPADHEDDSRQDQ